jgi:hypothetical protein
MGNFLNIDLPLIPDDSSYLAHLIASGDSTPGRKIQDLRGNFGAMLEAGTPSSLPVWQKNAVAGTPNMIGPFANANYYANTPTSDVLDSTGDRFGAVVFTGGPIGSINYIGFNGNGSSAGNEQFIAANGAFTFTSWVAALQTVATTNFIIPGAINVACWWRTGNNISAQMNFGPIATTNAGGLETIGTTIAFVIGVKSGATNAFAGNFIEMVQGLGTPPGGNLNWLPQNTTAGGAAIWAARVQQQVLDKCGLANAWMYPSGRFGNTDRTGVA